MRDQGMKAAPVAVTGMGCVCAAGQGVDNVFAALRAGNTEPGPALRLGATALPLPFFGVDEALFPHGRRHSAEDTLCLALHAAREAMAQACLTNAPAALRIGVVVGTTAGTALHFLAGYAARRAGATTPCQDIADLSVSNPALALAAHWRLCGPALTVSNACTSGADAIGLGLELIRQGRCDVVLCGGADALSLVPHTGFARLTVASAEPCRPFDVARKGLNLGEGAAMLVLESAVRAAKKTVLGYVAGYGTAADAHHFTAPHPQGRGLAAAVDMALCDAACTVDELGFVNVHGTATHDNDRVEGGVVRTCLPGMPVWASKGGTGHTLGAAGAIEALLCLTALRKGVVPVSRGFVHEDPELGVAPTTVEQPVTRQRAISLSLGFGGGNAALVLSAPGGNTV